MSIEKTITTLTDALNNVAKAVNRYCDLAEATPQTAPIAEVVVPGVTDEDVEQFKNEAAQAEPVAEAPVAAVEVEDTPAANKAAPAAPIGYDEAAAIVKQTYKAKGRDTISGIFAELGAKKLPDLKPSQYAKLVELCEAA